MSDKTRKADTNRLLEENLVLSQECAVWRALARWVGSGGTAIDFTDFDGRWRALAGPNECGYGPTPEAAALALMTSIQAIESTPIIPPQRAALGPCDVFWDGDGWYFIQSDDLNAARVGPLGSKHVAIVLAIVTGYTIAEVRQTRGSVPARK